MARATSPSTLDQSHPAGVLSLVIPVVVDVNQLAILGKQFLWEKPASCPKCRERLWWHGFVLAYLTCLAEAVFLRRLFCPHCRSIHRLRPASHWRRFQSSIKTIRETVAHRQEKCRWRPDLPRPRQRQWWRRLKAKSLLCLGLSIAGSPFDSFLVLMDWGAIPVSSVIKCDDG